MENRLLRIMVALQDFQDVKDIVWGLALDEPENPYVYNAARNMALVTYYNPFTHLRDHAGILEPTINEDDFLTKCTQRQKDLHGEIKEYRNRLLAHSDLTYKSKLYVHYDESGISTGYITPEVSIDMNEFEDLVSIAEGILEEESHYLEKKLEAQGEIPIIIRALIQAMKVLPAIEDWVSFTRVGKQLVSNGISYKEHNYSQLKKLIIDAEERGLVKTRNDDGSWYVQIVKPQLDTKT